ncbi:MAG TPA: DUF4157 domain-containing protein [Nostocaceae cyanobacterium]|nr:DUF4157 domain-containing protein [Nostocaceae cyanobacterium]
MAYQWGKRNNYHGNNSDQDRPNQFASRPFIVRPPEQEKTPQEPRTLSGESANQLRLSSITRPTPTVQPQTTPQSETELEQEEQNQESNDTIKLSSSGNPEQPNNHHSPNPTATIQTKLTIGEPGDKYEQEADTVAQKVMSGNTLQLSYWPEKTTPKNPVIARRKLPNTENTHQQIQTKSNAGTNQATPNLEHQLNSKKGGGGSLDSDTRTFMEDRFNADFSSVRVHTDNTAVQMSKELGAQAFTHGNDIFFGAGKTPGKNELTAHELTHTIQQTGGVKLQRKPDLPANKITQANYPTIQNKITTGIQPRIQRKTDPGQIFEQLKNTPPTQINTAYADAQANSNAAWSAQKEELQQSIPELPAPTGLQGQQTAESKQTAAPTAPDAANPEPSLPAANQPQTAPPQPQSAPSVNPAPPHPITPTRIAGGNQTQNADGTAANQPDPQVAASAQAALNQINLDSSQISTQAGPPPVVDLNDPAINPAQLDTEQQQTDQQVQQAKTQAAQDINKDYGENNIFPQASNEILKTNKQLTLAEIPGAPAEKAPTIPPEIAAQLDQSLAPHLQEKISPEQQKYITGKNQFDQDSTNAKTDADQQIQQLTEETKQKQLESQQQAQTDVQAAKQEWQAELDAAEQDYQQKAGKATADQRKKIETEKQKGDQEAAKHLADAEKQAEQEKQTAEGEAQKKKDEGEKESGGFLGWLADKAAAFIDGIKQAVNFIYDKLREAVKFIFEQAKKLALAAIELTQKAIVGLIQAYGEILKGIVSVVFAAFPEISKRINEKIDQAVNLAVQAVNAAADLLKQGVAGILDFLANTLDSLLKLVQDIYNGAFTVIGMILRGEFTELLEKLGNLVEAAKAAPPQFETAGLEELLGGNLDEPLSPMELAQAGVAPPGGDASAAGGGDTSELPQAPWSEANVGVDAVENNMQLSPELTAELIQQTNDNGEVELASSSDSSRSMEAIMSEVTGNKEGESQQGEGQQQQHPDDGLTPRQRAEIRWNLMKQGISQWWSNNWPTVLLGATAAIGGFIALNVATGGAITAALPAIMGVVGPLFTGVTVAQIGGHIRDYLAKGWEGDIQGGGKSLAKGLAAGAIELVSALTFKAGEAAISGARRVARGAVQGATRLARGAMNVAARGAKFIIEKGKVLFKGIAGTGIGRHFKRLRELGANLLERMRFKRFKIKLKGLKFQLWGEINPYILIAEGKIQEVAEGTQGAIRVTDDQLRLLRELPTRVSLVNQDLKQIKELLDKGLVDDQQLRQIGFPDDLIQKIKAPDIPLLDNIETARQFVSDKIKSGDKIVIDLFGGKNSDIPGAINFDLVAEQGIKGNLSELTTIFPPNSVDEIIASGPQAEFLSEAAKILKPGGRIYINANFSNLYKYGIKMKPKKIPDFAEIEKTMGLRLVNGEPNSFNFDNLRQEPRFENLNFMTTDGREINKDTVKTLIFERI